MAQSFVTTYKNHYRWQEIERTKSCKPRERFDEFKTDEDFWLRPDDDDDSQQEIKENPEEMIRKLYKNRMCSIYQVEYCKSLKDNALGALQTVSFENELLEYCRQLYEGDKKRNEIAPPSATSRKIFGYIRPARLYTPLSNYQFYFGKTGYELMRAKSTEETERKSTKKTTPETPIILLSKCRCNKS